VTLVLIRKDFLETARDDVPSMLRYRLHAEKESRLNTPPVFAIHALGRVLRWIEEQGGLVAMADRNEKKAALVYAALDARPDFYRGLSRPDSRSLMNVCFRAPSPELDRKLVAEAERRGLIGLSGYRDVGGLRASLYNACPMEACEALAGLLLAFGET
jgi:phosphoserine aminotransferase